MAINVPIHISFKVSFLATKTLYLSSVLSLEMKRIFVTIFVFALFFFFLVGSLDWDIVVFCFLVFLRVGWGNGIEYSKQASDT